MSDGPLAELIRARIRADGPMSIGTFMELALSHPEHGYYRRNFAILGESGDFITAPEISQTFGELIGLWIAMVWQQLGEPAAFDLVELGPGRGTLMADALRAMRVMPGVLSAAKLVLVEQNPSFQAAQRALLAPAGVPMQQTEVIPELQRPAIVIANEFLDALPIEQLESTAEGWRERVVKVAADGALAFGLGRMVLLRPDRLPASTAKPGDILEDRPAARALLQGLAQSARPFAALFIDYGYQGPAFGDTLQAVRRHQPEPVLASPGRADLSALVDFGALARDARRLGLTVAGPATQAEFLGELGIVERAEKLMRSTDARTALAIEAGVARLIDPSGMGSRFQIIGVSSSGLPPLPGFSRLHQ